jgi:hypothetical protein
VLVKKRVIGWTLTKAARTWAQVDLGGILIGGKTFHPDP